VGKCLQFRCAVVLPQFFPVAATKILRAIRVIPFLVRSRQKLHPSAPSIPVFSP
jgi:hypothetical protein